MAPPTWHTAQSGEHPPIHSHVKVEGFVDRADPESTPTPARQGGLLPRQYLLGVSLWYTVDGGATAISTSCLLYRNWHWSCHFSTVSLTHYISISKPPPSHLFIHQQVGRWIEKFIVEAILTILLKVFSLESSKLLCFRLRIFYVLALEIFARVQKHCLIWSKTKQLSFSSAHIRWV